MLRIVTVGFTCLVILFAAEEGKAQQRLALVVGNSDYKNLPSLKNPRKDATDIQKELVTIGFEVKLLKDASRKVLKREFDSLITKSKNLTEADVVLLYFAGHGVQLNDVNFLVPVDAKIALASDVHQEALNVSQMLTALAKMKGMVFFLLDACSDNPFAGTPGLEKSRGLAEIKVDAIVGSAKQSVPDLRGRDNNTLVFYC